MFFPFTQLAIPPAGALALLLALLFVAPPNVQGGCSHLVTSRSERGRQASLIDAFIVDGFGGDAEPSDARSLPPRTCSGAWCSGLPAAPAAPPATTEGRLEAWAWYEVPTGSTAVISTCFSADETDHRPQRPLGSIFRPPRLLPSA
jgi:hypothetical protein